MSIQKLDLTALTDELNATTSTEDSAAAALAAFGQAVLDANKVSQQAVADVVAQFAASREKLATAVANSSGTPPV